MSDYKAVDISNNPHLVKLYNRWIDSRMLNTTVCYLLKGGKYRRKIKQYMAHTMHHFYNESSKIVPNNRGTLKPIKVKGIGLMLFYKEQK